MKTKYIFTCISTLFLLLSSCFGQDSTSKLSDTLIFHGQISSWGNYNFNSKFHTKIGVRYIPTLEYDIQFPQKKLIDFELAANISGEITSHLFDSANIVGFIQPYRGWARYSTPQMEFRIGLQKIDFGSSTLLRPLQWFNQIDPRDPLRLTQGVYGFLGRYYFVNNANVWLWVLYGNDEIRGLEAIETNQKIPEMGGRVQIPTKKGEIAFSYHHRTANGSALMQSPYFNQIPEDRFGFDGKWDLKIGVWLEASHTIKHKKIGLLTNQNLLNLGLDYTFGVGNGINIIAEHLIISNGINTFNLNYTQNISATTISYPLGLFDNISGIMFFKWDSNAWSFYLNYSHQFKKITGYVMPYFNSDKMEELNKSELLQTYQGHGIRIMIVYNH